MGVTPLSVIDLGLLAERERIIRHLVAQHNAACSTKKFVADIFGGLRADLIDQVPEQELPALARAFTKVRNAWRLYVETN